MTKNKLAIEYFPGPSNVIPFWDLVWFFGYDSDYALEGLGDHLGQDKGIHRFTLTLCEDAGLGRGQEPGPKNF